MIDVSGAGVGEVDRGRSAVSQPAHSRPELNVQVLGPLAPAAAWAPSASSWRRPPMSQAWLIPTGEPIVTAVEAELIPMHPTSIAFAVAVVTPATVPEVLEAAHIVPFRGDYWVVRPDRRYLARNLIYPVPDPAFPFLGVHFTRRIADGAVWLGPNAVLAFAREGYRRGDLKFRDLLEALTYRGFQRLAARYWRAGLGEMWRDCSKRAFLASLQRYVPALGPDDLLPGPSGVRAQALDLDGKLVDDFVVDVQDRQVVHVRNAPSPAATSSLAIGRLIADKADEVFDLGEVFPDSATLGGGVL